MSEENNLSKNLVCILFPGVVKNDEKALECLGGIRKISETCSVSSKERLGLTFRPEHPNPKKIFADKKKTTGILLKVKIKKTITDNGIDREVISTSAVGRVSHMYSFNSLCDFQYLPITDSLPPKCLLDTIIPSGLDSLEKFLNLPVPPFIMPVSFARTDKPLCYSYTDKKEDANLEEESQNIHYRLRNNRKRPLVQFSFNMVDEYLTEPHPYYIDRITKNPKYKEGFELIKKLFEERPIWSKNAIRFKTKIKEMDLKMIMPSLSYSFKNGPWKLLWVRYGYDPRKEPGSRYYQCLDFRMRHDAGLNSLVAKHESIVYNRKVSRIKRAVDDEESTGYTSINEAAVMYRPGMIPSQRQIYYQYCDVKLDEVEELLAVEPPPDTVVDRVRGWLAPGVAEQCRECLIKYTKMAMQVDATDQSTLNSECSSSGDEDSLLHVSQPQLQPQPSTSSKCND